MINIQENISLKPFNTFGIDVKAKYFTPITSEEDIQEFCKEHMPSYNKFILLGGGSNILFIKDFEGIVIKLENRGIEIINEDIDNVTIKAASGVSWDELVEYCVKKNWGGIENLSNIPGSVGAAPIQNIGAYGVELKDVFVKLEAVEISSGMTRTFSKEECRFGYRDSIFKNELKGKYIIKSISLKLEKFPILKTEYGTIKEELKRMKCQCPDIKSIREAIINIRSSKLPDPEIIGNAGSFFKNPVIGNIKFERLKQKYPGIPCYKADEGNIKIPAAWLIDHCGWKGQKLGNAGVHKDHALVLVNHGDATGQEILSLAEAIQGSVYNQFGIMLTPEVNIV